MTNVYKKLCLKAINPTKNEFQMYCITGLRHLLSQTPSVVNCVETLVQPGGPCTETKHLLLQTIYEMIKYTAYLFFPYKLLLGPLIINPY